MKKRVFQVCGSFEASFTVEVEAFDEDSAQALVEEVFTLEQFLTGVVVVDESTVSQVCSKAVQ